MLSTYEYIHHDYLNNFGELRCNVSKFIYTLLFLFVCPVLFSHEVMADDVSQHDALGAHFDTNVSIDGSTKLAFEMHGGSIIRNGIKGGCTAFGTR